MKPRQLGRLWVEALMPGKIARGSCRFAAVSVVAFGIAACTHEAPPRTAADAPSPPSAAPTRGPHEGERVVAIVERLEHSAHQEGLETDPIVIVSDVVAFGIFQPVHFDTLLFAHVSGHPRIDGRPLLLGDAVSFILPDNWRNRDLALEELAGLAFVEEHR
jgi:hypothetical protein